MSRDVAAAPVRIGIAGAGKIVASEHVPRFRAIPGVELVAVANQTPESSRRTAEALGIPRVHGNWRDLLDDDEVDAILIGTWPYLHARIAVEALYAGRHVLTEARMATDADAAAEMAEAARDNPGLVAMVVPASFSLWADRAIGRLLGDGTIGRLLAVRVTWDGGTADDPGDFWRWQRRFSGNNVMALGILYEAMARWLGPAEWVTAETQIVRPRKLGRDGRPVPTDVPDHVVAIAGFAGDVTASIEMSTVTLAGTGIHVRFVGSDGTLAADFGDASLSITRPGATTPEAVTIAAEERDEWRAERDFVAAIRGEQPVELTDFDTGVGYMAFVDAVAESNARGKRVVLAVP
jgi:predicted dehydrogenase